MRNMLKYRFFYIYIDYFKMFLIPNVSNYFVSGQRKSRSDCTNAQSDLGLRCPHIWPEGTFS